MSRHWNPQSGGRSRRGHDFRLADLKEVAIMVVAGLLIGVVLALWPLLAPRPAPPRAAPTFADARPIDPWAESRRSRAILEGQEGAPAPADPGAQAAPVAGGDGGGGGGGGERVSPLAVRVIDGDTFALAGARIRIADIDAPEVHGRCASETALAARATARMGALLAAGPFTLARIGARDRDVYGRQLRIVMRGGRSLGDQLVAEGLARTWTGHREPWC
jgi:micrococcal nuclease